MSPCNPCRVKVSLEPLDLPIYKKFSKQHYSVLSLLQGDKLPSMKVFFYTES